MIRWCSVVFSVLHVCLPVCAKSFPKTSAWRTKVKQQKSIAKEHAKEVATFINTSEEAKASVLKKVQEKLPLKSVSDGDESIILGEFVIKALPPIELGRVAAQNAKGVIIQKVREADKSNQYEEYKDKVGEIAVGIVKRTEFGNLIIDLGKSEAIIKREELIPRETFKNVALKMRELADE